MGVPWWSSGWESISQGGRRGFNPGGELGCHALWSNSAGTPRETPCATTAEASVLPSLHAAPAVRASHKQSPCTAAKAGPSAATEARHSRIKTKERSAPESPNREGKQSGGECSLLYPSRASAHVHTAQFHQACGPTGTREQAAVCRQAAARGVDVLVNSVGEYGGISDQNAAQFKHPTTLSTAPQYSWGKSRKKNSNG